MSKTFVFIAILALAAFANAQSDAGTTILSLVQVDEIMTAPPQWKVFSHATHSTPVSLDDNGDVQCMSNNNQDCFWTDVATAQRNAANPPANLKPLVCGPMHTQKHGGPGYGAVGHWCEDSKQMLGYNPEAKRAREYAATVGDLKDRIRKLLASAALHHAAAADSRNKAAAFRAAAQVAADKAAAAQKAADEAKANQARLTASATAHTQAAQKAQQAATDAKAIQAQKNAAGAQHEAAATAAGAEAAKQQALANQARVNAQAKRAEAKTAADQALAFTQQANGHRADAAKFTAAAQAADQLAAQHTAAAARNIASAEAHEREAAAQKTVAAQQTSAAAAATTLASQRTADAQAATAAAAAATTKANAETQAATADKTASNNQIAAAATRSQAASVATASAKPLVFKADWELELRQTELDMATSADAQIVKLQGKLDERNAQLEAERKKAEQEAAAAASAAAAALQAKYKSCQAISDAFGTDHGKTWGSAPADAQSWWGKNNCQTRPAAVVAAEAAAAAAAKAAAEAWERKYTCQGISDNFGTDHGKTWGSAPADAQQWWGSHSCTTRPAAVVAAERANQAKYASCQAISDAFGTDHNVTWGSAPADAQQWWGRNNCQTRPTPKYNSCQQISDMFDTDHNVTWGRAPADAQVWWSRNGCTTRPAAAVARDLAQFNGKFQFYSQKDDGGNDIAYLGQYANNIVELMKWCNANENCLSFNTAGWMKHRVNPTNHWQNWGSRSVEGLYVKTAPAPVSQDNGAYTFHPQQDSSLSDIAHVPQIAGNINAQKDYCDARSDCKGFNTQGWFKNTIRPTNEWYRWTGAANHGFYIKNFSRKVAPASDGQFEWIQGMDDGGNDIVNLGHLANNIPALKQWCSQTENCLGFNTNGWMKHRINPRHMWNRWSNDASQGFFVKRPAQPVLQDGGRYTFLQGQDSSLSDFSHQGHLAGNIAAQKQFCDQHSQCKGFNTQGWFKHAIRPAGEWYRWTGSPSGGFYVKNDRVGQLYTNLNMMEMSTEVTAVDEQVAAYQAKIAKYRQQAADHRAAALAHANNAAKYRAQADAFTAQAKVDTAAAVAAQAEAVRLDASATAHTNAANAARAEAAAQTIKAQQATAAAAAATQAASEAKAAAAAATQKANAEDAAAAADRKAAQASRDAAAAATADAARNRQLAKESEAKAVAADASAKAAKDRESAATAAADAFDRAKTAAEAAQAAAERTRAAEAAAGKADRDAALAQQPIIDNALKVQASETAAAQADTVAANNAANLAHQQNQAAVGFRTENQQNLDKAAASERDALASVANFDRDAKEAEILIHKLKAVQTSEYNYHKDINVRNQESLRQQAAAAFAQATQHQANADKAVSDATRFRNNAAALTTQARANTAASQAATALAAQHTTDANNFNAAAQRNDQAAANFRAKAAEELKLKNADLEKVALYNKQAAEHAALAVQQRASADKSTADAAAARDVAARKAAQAADQRAQAEKLLAAAKVADQEAAEQNALKAKHEQAARDFQAQAVQSGKNSDAAKATSANHAASANNHQAQADAQVPLTNAEVAAAAKNRADAAAKVAAAKAAAEKAAAEAKLAAENQAAADAASKAAAQQEQLAAQQRQAAANAKAAGDTHLANKQKLANEQVTKDGAFNKELSDDAAEWDRLRGARRQWVGYSGEAAPAPSTQNVGVRWEFAAGVDSNGNDISNQGQLANNVPALKQWCEARADCKGFNNNGWMKHTLLPRAQWNQWTTEAGKGFYFKA